MWDGLEAVGLAYEEICEPRWFDEADEGPTKGRLPGVMCGGRLTWVCNYKNYMSLAQHVEWLQKDAAQRLYKMQIF